ncbi:MAG: histidine kinase [Bryobacteraceae bacterium]
MRTPTARLIAGLVFTLLVISAYAAYTLRSVQRMRGVQTSIVERNRLASLQLIRIQNDLNALGLSLRDILDEREGYPLAAWRPALQRIRENLQNAVEREDELSAGWRPAQQTTYLRSSFADFWRTVDTLFAQPTPAAAHALIRTTLQPRQEALTALAARLLVENNERDSQAANEARAIYESIERNAWLLLGISVALTSVTGLGLIRANRRLIAHLATLAEERRELAQQLISSQESTFRSISRDLHDEFGQILTAIGALLRRAERHAPTSAFQSAVHEVSEVAQATLEKTRSLSQSLQPVILEEQGLLAAVQWHLANFERHTGIAVRAQLPAAPILLPAQQAIHVYRILQEALNNVARHADVQAVSVTLDATPGSLQLAIHDSGKGIPAGLPAGVGLSAMRERAELAGGVLLIETPAGGKGTRVLFTLVTDAAMPAQETIRG